MSWSTRELADLAGTTVNTVRHYHSLGLLAEPERRYNGYKQYGVSHLVTLIHVRRLVELSVPLARIAGIDANSAEAVRDIDTELRADIDRLRRVRADISAIARANAPLDAPRGFEAVASRLSEADRALVDILSRVLPRTRIVELARMIEDEPPEVTRAFADLPVDAGERSRRELAHAVAACGDWRAVGVPGAAGRALADARRELYTPAQRDVVEQAAALGAPDPAPAEVRRSDLVRSRSAALGRGPGRRPLLSTRRPPARRA